MGTLCSKLDKAEYPHGQHEKDPDTSSPRIPTRLYPHRQKQPYTMSSQVHDEGSVPLVIGKYVKSARTRLDEPTPEPLLYQAAEGTQDITESVIAEYHKDRAEIASRGDSLGFDYALSQSASKPEREAREKLEIIEWNDKVVFYDSEAPLTAYGGQKHPRFPADHFLTNADLLEKTVLFQVTKTMPKGTHLHIHFNSCLLPHVLLEIAESMETMYICSNLPLTSKTNCHACEIQFLVRKPDVVSGERQELAAQEGVSLETLEGGQCNLFDSSYKASQGKQGPWMNYKLFRQQWEKIRETHPERWGEHADFKDSKSWLMSKLVFQEQEAHHPEQTPEGAWEKFNGRTRMMKGLFNYETAFTEYTKKCLGAFAEDGIQYAEIRPNFMQTNQIWKDDGSGQLNNRDTLEIIIKEWNAFNKRKPGTLFGLKVIYCTPRSFPNDKVRAALQECLDFKMNNNLGKYIAGFDLVGEESKGKPLKDFVPEFLWFKQQCREHDVEIPFLFHCGETLELGGDTDGNLLDALLLDSKRIGHGFALARKPYLMAEFKKRKICLELCPISNEVLGLTPRVGGHAMYELLANNVHCTVNSDNGTLFRSTLSHDFYQVMVGSKSMNLHGWRQLIQWSIEHASLDKQERENLLDMWRPKWADFVTKINTDFHGIERINPPPAFAPAKLRDGETEPAFRARAEQERAYSKKCQAQFEDDTLNWRNRVQHTER